MEHLSGFLYIPTKFMIISLIISAFCNLNLVSTIELAYLKYLNHIPYGNY